MKAIFIKTIVTSVAILPIAINAQIASSNAVGYVSLGGQPAVKAKTDVNISIPLERDSVFIGVLNSNPNGNILSFTGTPFLGVNYLSEPHVVTFKNNAGSGIVGIITASTNNTLTISLQPGDSLSGIVNGDQIGISKAWTISSLLGLNLPIGTQLFTYGGNAPGVNFSPEGIYEWTGVAWEDAVIGDNANNVVLYPNESLILRNNSTSAISSLVVNGNVPTSKSVVNLNRFSTGSQDIPFAYISPVEEVFSSASIPAVTGDLILSFDNSSPGLNKSPSFIYEYTGTAWEDAVSGANVTNTASFTGGKSYIYRRAPSASASYVKWSDSPSNTP
jgi:uncharacterized protein (TIGR02597 family)